MPTGYGYVLPDQNGWSRYLHFQAAWVVVLTGLLYVIFGLLTGHFRKNLLPAQGRSFVASVLDGDRQPFALRAAERGRSLVV